MRSKQQYSKSQNNLKRIQFYSLFEEIVPHTAFFWHPIEPSNPPDPRLTLFQGKLLNKTAEEDKWESQVFELQPDRLLKKCVTNEGSDYSECTYMGACFVKKFNHYDPSLPNHRFGIRLQLGINLSHFLTDSADNFKKWFTLLRRLCILDKFNRKYKVIAKLKYVDPLLGQSCYSCVRIQDAGYYIVKIIEKDLLAPQQKSNFFKETFNLRRLQQYQIVISLSHTQIVYFVELFEDETHIYQVFEHYLGSDLRQHLRETQIYAMAEQSSVGLDEKLLSDLMFGLVQAISHMHSKGVFHRDIKLDNIFVPDKKRLPFALLTNFCYSETFKFNEDSQQIFKKCGTPGYVAPEIFKTKSYTSKVDMFSLGVVFYILVYGKMPFEGRDQEEILKANERGDIDFKIEQILIPQFINKKKRKKLCKKLSQSGVDLLRAMLMKDANKRISSAQAMNHHWFIKMKSKNESRPRLNPKQRSLSTIVENSEIMDITQSFYQTNSTSKGKQSTRFSRPMQTLDQQSTNILEEKVEKEFEFDTLNDKICWINSMSTNKAPSKQRHGFLQQKY